MKKGKMNFVGGLRKKSGAWFWVIVIGGAAVAVWYGWGLITFYSGIGFP